MSTADPTAFVSDPGTTKAMTEVVASLVSTDPIFLRVSLSAGRLLLGSVRQLQTAGQVTVQYTVLVPQGLSTSPSLDSILSSIANAQVSQVSALAAAALATYTGGRFGVTVMSLSAPTVALVTTSSTTSTTSSSTFTGTKFVTNTRTSSTTSTFTTSTVTTETLTASKAATSTATTTITPPPPPPAVVSPAAACADVIAFTDVKGLSCKDWSVLNCSGDADTSGYSQDELARVRKQCPAACGLCSVAAPFVVTVAKKVSSELAFEADLRHLDEASRIDALTTSVASALGVPYSNVVNLQILLDNSTGTGTSRRLQGGIQAYKVKYEVVVPPSKQVRDIMLQATTLSLPNSDSLNIFSQVMQDGYGVDSKTISLQVTSQPVAVPVDVVLQGDEVVGTPASSTSTSNSSSGGGGSPVVVASCMDEEAFIDELGESCSGWVGLDCTDRKWLRTERPYSVKGLRKVVESCPLACGLCEVPGRPTFAKLQDKCIDDPLIAGWCARWRGLNCSSATELGYSPRYASLLLDRCPQSCGLCGAAALACVDAPGFVDEQGQPCAAWKGYDCTREYGGYTRKGMLEVQAACPASCGWCGSAQGLDNPPAITEPAQCEDNASYTYLQQFTCRDFIGHTCTFATLYLEPRWLLGPHAVNDWHQKLWSACPVSCARCTPEGRPTPEDLRTECEDDPYFKEWCAKKWKGQDCLQWQRSVRLVVDGEASKYNTTLIGRCQQTCNFCTKPVCGDGTFRNRTAHSCDACPPGRYAAGNRSGADALECRLAEPGFHVSEVGATKQTACDAGTFTATPGQSECSNCSMGYYNNFRGMSTCIPCPVGWYQDKEGSTECSRCTEGTYAGSNATVTCDHCPLDYTTLLQASTAIEHCVCPVGTYKHWNWNASMGPTPCVSCPQAINCPGGFPYVNDSRDDTPRLMAGVMSTWTEPFSAYLCAAADTACLDERPLPLSEEDMTSVCPDLTSGPRCWTCPDNGTSAYHDDSNACFPCDTVAGRTWKLVLFLILQLVFTQDLYRQEGAVQSGAKIMFLAVLGFMQTLMALSQIPLEWPIKMQWLLDILVYFGYDGILSELVDFRHECYFGPGLLPRVLRDVGLPLLPFINFAIIGAINRILRREMAWGAAANVVAGMYFGFFVNLAVMALQLFPGEQMPNGKYFLIAFPGVELGSPEWKKGVPISIIAIAVYCVTFIAYAAHAIYVAPSKTDDEWFMESRDWMVGEINPQCFWWPLVDVVYGFLIAVIQALSPNIYLDIYLEMAVLLGYTMLVITYSPCTYGAVNKTNVALNVGLLIFMAFSTGFINTTLVDRGPERLYLGLLLVVMLFCLLAYLIVQVGLAIYRMCTIHPLRENVEQAHRTRILMQALILMPEAEFIGALGPDKIFDPDIKILQEGNKVLVSCFLHQQIGRHLFQQRVMKGKEFKVFSQKECRTQAWGGQLKTQAFSSLEESARLTKLTSNLAVKVLRPIASEETRLALQDAGHTGPIISHTATRVAGRWSQQLLAKVLPEVPAAHVNFAPGDPDAPKTVGAIGLTKLVKRLEKGRSGYGRKLATKMRNTLHECGATLIDEEAFVRELRDIADMPEATLREVYRHIDVSKQGQLQASHVVAMLMLLGEISSDEEEEIAENQASGQDRDHGTSQGDPAVDTLHSTVQRNERADLSGFSIHAHHKKERKDRMQKTEGCECDPAEADLETTSLDAMPSDEVCESDSFDHVLVKDRVHRPTRSTLCNFNESSKVISALGTATCREANVNLEADLEGCGVSMAPSSSASQTSASAAGTDGVLKADEFDSQMWRDCRV